MFHRTASDMILRQIVRDGHITQTTPIQFLDFCHKILITSLGIFELIISTKLQKKLLSVTEKWNVQIVSHVPAKLYIRYLFNLTLY